MTIEFYYMPESPPCRTVEMTAAIAGVKLNLHYINLFEGQHKSDEFAKLNPTQKVPFIVDGNLKIGESRAIGAYIANKYMPEDNSFYPRDPVRRAQVDEALWFEGTSLFISGSFALRPLLFEGKEIDPEAEKKFRDNLKILDGKLSANSQSKYLLGNEITLADVAIASTMSFVEACSYDISQYGSLKAYVDRLKQDIPRYHEITDKAIANTKTFIEANKSKNK